MSIPTPASDLIRAAKKSLEADLSMKKSELIQIAESIGAETRGVKAVIIRRIVAKRTIILSDPVLSAKSKNEHRESRRVWQEERAAHFLQNLGEKIEKVGSKFETYISDIKLNPISAMSGSDIYFEAAGELHVLHEMKASLDYRRGEDSGDPETWRETACWIRNDLIGNLIRATRNGTHNSTSTSQNHFKEALAAAYASMIEEMRWFTERLW